MLWKRVFIDHVPFLPFFLLASAENVKALPGIPDLWQLHAKSCTIWCIVLYFTSFSTVFFCTKFSNFCSFVKTNSYILRSCRTLMLFYSNPNILEIATIKNLRLRCKKICWWYSIYFFMYWTYRIHGNVKLFFLFQISVYHWRGRREAAKGKRWENQEQYIQVFNCNN